jgi:hypothetical protein
MPAPDLNTLTRPDRRSLLVHLRYTNVTKGYGYSSEYVLVTFPHDVEPGTRGVISALNDLFELGRKSETTFVDTATGTVETGWTTRNRAQYDDTREYYTREVWVSVGVVMTSPEGQEYLVQGRHDVKTILTPKGRRCRIDREETIA